MPKSTLVFSTITFTLLGLLIFVAVLYKTFQLFEHKEDKQMRYFLIGYDASNAQERSYGSFMTKEDSMPNIDYLGDMVYGFLKCKTSFKPEQVIITSLFEFKDSLEYAKFGTKRDRGYHIQCK